MANLRAKKRKTYSKAHAIAIAQEAQARGMKNVKLYRKHGLLRTTYIITYLDKSRGEKVKGGLGKAGSGVSRGIKAAVKKAKYR